MLKQAGVLIFCWLLTLNSAWAAMADYAPAFEIDLETDTLPTLEELENYFKKQNTLYDPRYESVWDLGDVFDKGFQRVISTYGMSEKRLKAENEDLITDMLKQMPESMYEYIGPMMFLVPGMSEKILNMPGIKETKNRFPTRIAPQLKDVEDIEFLSPFLYYILMPEAWQSNDNRYETITVKRSHPKVVHNSKFYQFLRMLVPPEKYMPGAEGQTKITRSDMRTINPDKNDLLTSADVKAFVRTLDGVNEWMKSDDHLFKIGQVGIMWAFYDENRVDEKYVPVQGLKDLANPCQRLVQKAVILGEEMSLARAVVKEGFTLNQWAYTCDKTLKAYRVSYMSLDLLETIKSYRSGSYAKGIANMSPFNQEVSFATMQAVMEMYKAPLSDVLEVRKNRKELQQKFIDYGFDMIGGIDAGRLD